MKIRIPRKIKKKIKNDKFDDLCNNHFFGKQQKPKILKYHYYNIIENGIKRYNLNAEELVDTFGFYMYDHVIWWNFINLKYNNLKPMSEDFIEYWDELSGKENLPKWSKIKYLIL